MWRPCCDNHLTYFFCLSILIVVVSAGNEGNPADEIVNSINENRTTSKLPKLYNSPGLGCMALQYISECAGNCTINNTLSCKPPEVDITEVYAPNCGVELPTVDIITGHLVGCHWSYLDPKQALSTILIANKKANSLLHSKEHTEVGVGFSRAQHRGAYFWCVLFSSGRTNSTFVLERGVGIKQENGCFSGSNFSCSAGRKLAFFEGLSSVLLVLIIYFVFSVVIHL